MLVVVVMAMVEISALLMKSVFFAGTCIGNLKRFSTFLLRYKFSLACNLRLGFIH